jgi:hypothetical protein
VRRLEQDLKKYLRKRFEEERIERVRKTTNWNWPLGERVEAALAKDGGGGGGGQSRFLNATQARSTAKSHKDGGGRRANTRAVLLDFEEYMLQARRGGTNSRLRRGGRGDEDIQASRVQRELDISDVEGNKQFWAVPLNTTFSSPDAIWEMVKNTRAHEIDHQEVEFSLSVMLTPYPSNVFSVWVYIAVLRDAARDAGY